MKPPLLACLPRSPAAPDRGGTCIFLPTALEKPHEATPLIADQAAQSQAPCDPRAWLWNSDKLEHIPVTDDFAGADERAAVVEEPNVSELSGS